MRRRSIARTFAILLGLTAFETASAATFQLDIRGDSASASIPPLFSINGVNLGFQRHTVSFTFDDQAAPLTSNTASNGTRTATFSASSGQIQYDPIAGIEFDPILFESFNVRLFIEDAPASISGAFDTIGIQADLTGQRSTFYTFTASGSSDLFDLASPLALASLLPTIGSPNSATVFSRFSFDRNSVYEYERLDPNNPDPNRFECVSSFNSSCVDIFSSAAVTRFSEVDVVGEVPLPAGGLLLLTGFGALLLVRRRLA